MQLEWTQPFRWGLLLAFDEQESFDLPPDLGDEAITSSPSCLAVPVLHAADIDVSDDWPEDVDPPSATVTVTVVVGEPLPTGVAEFDGQLSCPSGRLAIGTAENERTVDVPPGSLRVQVDREPAEYASHVTMRIAAAREPD
ncbi:hypothetical protein [Cellulosimicrobium funkei]|uniref:Uncharacterized protein n=1 Tax=Cellulosimicrobium funkei TaxID=264251 RepID=A0A4Y8R7C2_9MICO|nr:hypothetical protein [Cellulosimicrobium funkei]TFF17417.1 hypothetical protein E1O70_01130 [Cellulosimicrobium funkei]TGA74055.1 hypothetical protein EQW79_008395 [Cellulosimicrobium terreum]